MPLKKEDDKSIKKPLKKEGHFILKELVLVLIGSFQFGALLYGFYLGFKWIMILFGKKDDGKQLSEDNFKKDRKRAIICAVSLAVLMTIKFLVF